MKEKSCEKTLSRRHFFPEYKLQGEGFSFRSTPRAGMADQPLALLLLMEGVEEEKEGRGHRRASTSPRVTSARPSRNAHVGRQRRVCSPVPAASWMIWRRARFGPVSSSGDQSLAQERQSSSSLNRVNGRGMRLRAHFGPGPFAPCSQAGATGFMMASPGKKR